MRVKNLTRWSGSLKMRICLIDILASFPVGRGNSILDLQTIKSSTILCWNSNAYYTWNYISTNTLLFQINFVLNFQIRASQIKSGIALMVLVANWKVPPFNIWTYEWKGIIALSSFQLNFFEVDPFYQGKFKNIPCFLWPRWTLFPHFPNMTLLPYEVNKFSLINKNNLSYQKGVLFQIHRRKSTKKFEFSFAFSDWREI